jgi:hypothetical protein
MLLFWLALTFLLVATIVSVTFAVRRALETWRAFKRVGSFAGAELDRIAHATGEIELHLQAAARSAEQLDGSLARLSTSRARLDVLTTAFADARASLGRAYPRK